MSKIKNEPTHVTKADGNVFTDLGFDDADAIVMQMKVDLHTEIVKVVKNKKLSPRELEKLFDEPQPRISELLRGKVSNLSITKLTEYASRLGIRPKIAFDKIKAA